MMLVQFTNLKMISKYLFSVGFPEYNAKILKMVDWRHLKTRRLGCTGLAQNHETASHHSLDKL